MSKEKEFRQDIVNVRDILPDIEGGVNDFLAIRYISAILPLFDGDEDKAIDDCVEVLKIPRFKAKSIWNARYGILKHNEVLFQLSGDIIRRKIRVLYDRLLNSLLERDYKAESVKTVMEVLRTVAQIDTREGFTDGMVSSVKEGKGSSNSVNVLTNDKCVIIVPMPESAVLRTAELDDGTLINGDILDTDRKREVEEAMARTEEYKKQREDVVADIAEEIKGIDKRVNAKLE